MLAVRGPTIVACRRTDLPRPLKRLVVLLGIVVPLVLLGAMPAGAKPAFPEVIDLPTGIAPEGIALGTGTEFFTGSLLTGQIYKGDLRTGTGTYVNDPADFTQPRQALGMAHDRRSDILYVAGGVFGQAYVYDADTGATRDVLQLTTAQPTFVNDVIVTRDAAFFSDSWQPVIYRVPLTRAGLPTGSVQVLPLTGDFVFTGAPGDVNGNGIDATPNGETLLLVNYATGVLYTVDPDTGAAREVDLGGDTMVFGDGMVLKGQSLYVVQNFLNKTGVWQLSPDLSQASRVKDLTSPEYRVPTTAAILGDGVYTVNGRFDIVFPGQPADGIEFQIVRVRR